MLLHPTIIALLVTSAINAVLLVAAGLFAIRLLRHWDLASGSELQIRLERQTYLVSTFMVFVCVTELLSLLLFVYNAERMSVLFTGAMCAVGTLSVNRWGFPTLLAKLAVFFAATAWLALNWLDNRGRDYPLTRRKYAWLLVLIPLFLAEALLQTLYFVNLDPDVITSCCGSLFSERGEGVSADLAAVEPRLAMAVFYSALILTLALGVWVWRRGRGGAAYGAASLGLFAVSIAAVVSFISLYVYEHPHHHCPFCLLKGEFHYVGYPLYGLLFTATALGLAVGVIHPYAAIPSLATIVPQARRRLTLISLLGFAAFGLLATALVTTSRLVLLDR